MYPTLSLVCIAQLLILQAGILFAADAFSNPLTNAAFSQEEHIEDNGKSYNLKFTGEATRSKISVKTYSVAHYLQDPKHGDLNMVLEQVFDDNKAKHLTFVWAKNVELNKIKDDYYQTFQKVLSEDEKESQDNNIDAFTRLIDRDARKTDHHSLHWLPGGRIQFSHKWKVDG